MDKRIELLLNLQQNYQNNADWYKSVGNTHMQQYYQHQADSINSDIKHCEKELANSSK